MYPLSSHFPGIRHRFGAILSLAWVAVQILKYFANLFLFHRPDRNYFQATINSYRFSQQAESVYQLPTEFANRNFSVFDVVNNHLRVT